MILPPLYGDLDDAAYDFTFAPSKDLAFACHLLRHNGRIEAEYFLRLIILPRGNVGSSHELPIRLEIEMTVRLKLPEICGQEHRLLSKKRMIELEDCQRRLLTYLFPPAAQTPASFTGEIDIPFFYSVLKPAPPMGSISAQNSMQPAGLRQTLLPFQRRTVGWLIEREGKVVRRGKIVNNSSNDVDKQKLPMFWEKLDCEGGQTLYIHRLTGDLLSSPPLVEESIALGGILAEEPGLGKTLECISLIMLNPAGSKRNPSVQRWDEEARLDVKEIKVSFPLCDVHFAPWIVSDGPIDYPNRYAAFACHSMGRRIRESRSQSQSIHLSRLGQSGGSNHRS